MNTVSAKLLNDLLANAVSEATAAKVVYTALDELFNSMSGVSFSQNADTTLHLVLDGSFECDIKIKNFVDLKENAE